MAQDDPALSKTILDAMRSLRKADVRINEIRQVLGNRLTSQEINAALEVLASTGRVCVSHSRRWTLVEPATTHTPSVEIPAPSARPSTRRATASPPSVPHDLRLPVVEDSGIPTEMDDDGVVDQSQREVIRDGVSARQIVEAGPGFGKTAVACARVAWLLLNGVAPARILLLSFTRTAVREMRARILDLARGVRDAGSVEIRTIDSFAWRVRTGLTERPAEGQGYAQNIDETLSMLASPTAELREYLDGFDHVLIDEAQDLVGTRAILIATLLRGFRDDAGWTVFLDPAQAIYDWSEEGCHEAPRQEAFESLLAALKPAPVRRTLRHLHRTRDGELRKLLLGARALVLRPNEANPCGRLRGIIKARLAGEPIFASHIPDVLTSCGCEPGNLLVLVRRRSEAFEVSARLSEGGLAHRLRFGGLPQVAAPWIAPVMNRTFVSVGEQRPARADVEAAWDAVSGETPWLTAGWSFDNAWKLLRRLGAGGSKSTVDIGTIATRLAMSSLPDDVIHRELGAGGPTVSTIHGSKGRESPHAMFLLTHIDETDPAEARVLYVGLSRAKERLHVWELRSSRWYYLSDSGRPWRRTKAGDHQVEIGRVGDFDPFRSVRAAGPDLARQQSILAAYDGRSQSVRIAASKARNWIRYVVADNSADVPLAALSSTCERDLLHVARKSSPEARTPTSVRHLRWFDLTSVGLLPDAAMKLDLPEPWHTTRLLLAPVVLGPGLIYGAST